MAKSVLKLLSDFDVFTLLQRLTWGIFVVAALAALAAVAAEAAGTASALPHVELTSIQNREIWREKKLVKSEMVKFLSLSNPLEQCL